MSAVALRLTSHDGAAQSPREFMEAGRRAVTTCSLPFSTRVRQDDVVGICLALREALSFEYPDEAAASYYQEKNSTEHYLSELEKLGIL
jgi:hypothetical protein